MLRSFLLGRAGAPESREERFGLSPKVLDLGGEEMSGVALGDFSVWRRGQRVRLTAVFWFTVGFAPSRAPGT